MISSRRRVQVGEELALRRSRSRLRSGALPGANTRLWNAWPSTSCPLANASSISRSARRSAARRGAANAAARRRRAWLSASPSAPTPNPPRRSFSSCSTRRRNARSRGRPRTRSTSPIPRSSCSDSVVAAARSVVQAQLELVEHAARLLVQHAEAQGRRVVAQRRRQQGLQRGQVRPRDELVGAVALAELRAGGRVGPVIGIDRAPERGALGVDSDDGHVDQPDPRELVADVARVLVHRARQPSPRALPPHPVVEPPARVAGVEHRDHRLAVLRDPLGDLAELARLLALGVKAQHDDVGVLDRPLRTPLQFRARDRAAPAADPRRVEQPARAPAHVADVGRPIALALRDRPAIATRERLDQAALARPGPAEEHEVEGLQALALAHEACGRVRPRGAQRRLESGERFASRLLAMAACQFPGQREALVQHVSDMLLQRRGGLQALLHRCRHHGIQRRRCERLGHREPRGERRRGRDSRSRERCAVQACPSQ